MLGAVELRPRRQRGDDRHRRPRHPRRLAGLRRRQQRRRPRRRRPALPDADPQVRLQRLERGQGDRLRRRPRRRRDQHELRHRPGGPQPSQAVRDAVDYAFAHNVVMAAAAADTPIAEQGYPANLLQPTGTGARPRRRQGPVGDRGRRRPTRARRSPGSGSQISLAAYGAYDSSPAAAGRRGSSAPSRRAQRARDRVGRAAAAPAVQLPHHLRAATRATPTCRAPRWRRRWSRPPARSSATSTPTSAAEIVRLIKETARRPAGGVDRRPGLGDPRRGRRADPRGEHRPPRAGVARQARCRRARQAHDHRALGGGRHGPAGRARVGHRALRAVARDRRRSLQAPVLDHAHVAPRSRCAAAGAIASTRVAIDHAGNREPAPKQADARIARRR